MTKTMIGGSVVALGDAGLNVHRAGNVNGTGTILAAVRSAADIARAL